MTELSGRGTPADVPRILLLGNPNAGKTTLFNALSGARARVANYPGVTVEQRSARLAIDGVTAELIDLPGTYSLSARSPEEEVAVDALLGLHARRPDAVVVVVDATALGRHLYLAWQVVETGVPTVIALSMMDAARERRIAIDVDRLAAALGAPVVPIVASKKEGLDVLVGRIATMLARPSEAPKRLIFDDDTERDVRELEEAVAAHLPAVPSLARRAYALFLLLSVGGDELRDIPPILRERVEAIRARAHDDGRDLDQRIIAVRYRAIDGWTTDAVHTSAHEPRTLTDRVDAVLTHRVAGLLVFVLVMLLVFQSLFSWAEPFMGAIEAAIAWGRDAVRASLPPGALTDLLADGVLAGVGNVVVFVPQLAMLFFFIGVLEDSGYLARVAFVIDRLMAGVGLHGRAFVPLLSGFACAIPAVLATRTIENRRDRLVTMLALPLMSCSARLPVFVLVIATVFPRQERLAGVVQPAALALLAMYALSVAATLGAAAIFRRTVLRGPRPVLVLELPPYRWPLLRNLVATAWERTRTFLVDAGTVILALSIVLWAVLSFPRSAADHARFDEERIEVRARLDGGEEEAALSEIDAREQSAILRGSLGGRLGRMLEPVIAPLGFDWRLGVGIVGAFAAREVFVSTLGIVFGMGDTDETSEPLRESLRAATWEGGAPLMTPLAGVSLMVFFVLACQCMSTLAVVKRESGSWRWPAFLFAYMTVLAYSVSLLVYQVGYAFGWGTG